MAEASDILVIEGIEAGYFPDVPILSGVGATLGQGEMVTIVGPNGAGKSTLVRVVIGLLRTVGRVRFASGARTSPGRSHTRSSHEASVTSPRETTSSQR